MPLNFRRAGLVAALALVLAAGSVLAEGAGQTIKVGEGSSVRARIDSAVARAATEGVFSIVELDGDFMRYRARVGSLISFLTRRNEENQRQILQRTAERREKDTWMSGQQERYQRLFARSQDSACGAEELKMLKEFTDGLEKDVIRAKAEIERIDNDLTTLHQSSAQAEHDITFLTPYSRVNETSTGKERPVIERMTIKNGSAVYFDATLTVEDNILAALAEAKTGFAALAEEAQVVANRQRAITAEFLKRRDELIEIGTRQQHTLLAALAVIDSSYEALTRGLTNASLDLAECAVEGKTPAGGLIVALSKGAEAILIYKATGEMGWSNFDVDKLEEYYQVNKDVPVSGAWLMLNTKSYWFQQLIKVPNTLLWEPVGVANEALDDRQIMIKAAKAALSESEKQAVIAARVQAIRNLETVLARETLDELKQALITEMAKPTKAQMLKPIYEQIVRLRGANSEAAKAMLQAVKLTFMDELANVAGNSVDPERMRQLYDVVNQQRAAVRAADEALAESTDAVRQLAKAGDAAREEIGKLDIKSLIKNPDFLKEFFREAGKGILKGMGWDLLRAGAQSALDEYYGQNWINFYRAYMTVHATLKELAMLNQRWQSDYDILRHVEKELSDAIAMRDASVRFYNRYLSRMQGTEGLHVAVNEIPRSATGELLLEIQGIGALYGHEVTLRGDAGFVDLEPASPLPSYDTIGDPQVREAVEQASRKDTFTYKTPAGFALRNICTAARQDSAGGKCDIYATVYYK